MRATFRSGDFCLVKLNGVSRVYDSHVHERSIETTRAREFATDKKIKEPVTVFRGDFVILAAASG